jgi:hypothetical protein
MMNKHQFHVLYQVIKESTAVLKLIDECDFKHNWLKCDLIYLVRFLNESIWDSVLQKDRLDTVTDPFRTIYERCKLHLLPSLFECLEFISVCLGNIRDKETNCFGVYNERVLQVEMDIVLEYVSLLFGKLWNSDLSTISCLSFSCLLPDSRFDLTANINAVETNTHLSSFGFPSTLCLSMKLFWVKFFFEEFSVKWIDFIESFCSFYSLPCNINGEEAYSDAFQTFYNCLVDDLHFSSPNFNINQAVVEYHRLARFCRGDSENHNNSLFACFQERCDPGTYLYVFWYDQGSCS